MAEENSQMQRQKHQRPPIQKKTTTPFRVHIHQQHEVRNVGWPQASKVRGSVFNYVGLPFRISCLCIVPACSFLVVVCMCAYVHVHGFYHNLKLITWFHLQLANHVNTHCNIYFK